MVCIAASCGRQEGSKEDNPVIEAIMSRRSIRKYQDKAVPRDLLAKIADCGLKYILAVGWPEEAPDARPRDEGKVRFVEFE